MKLNGIWIDQIKHNGISISFMLRALTLATKFFFIIFLAKELTAYDFGRWIIIVASINYLVLIVGAEIYNLTLRDYIQNKNLDSIHAIYKQWKFHLLVYVVIILTSFLLSIINNSYIFFITSLILILEHLTFEFYRYSIYVNKIISANLILFIKSACWMAITIGISFYLSGTNIFIILMLWLIGLLGCTILCFWQNRVFVKTILSQRKKAFTFHLASYYKRLLPFIILSLSIRTPFIADKYIITYFFDSSELSLYGYYFNFAMGIQSLFEAVFVASFIPLILKKNKKNKIKLTNKYIFLSIPFWCLSLAFIYLSLPIFDQYIGKTSYMIDLNLLFVIFFGQFFFSIAALIQYTLYSEHKDKSIWSGSVIFLVISILSFFILIPYYGASGAASALLISSLLLFICRLYQLRIVK
tara:strand:+ start:2382 stop:3620 length:1239 start_codon:yes stop_codon:yes gene_type:complete